MLKEIRSVRVEGSVHAKAGLTTPSNHPLSLRARRDKHAVRLRRKRATNEQSGVYGWPRRHRSAAIGGLVPTHQDPILLGKLVKLHGSADATSIKIKRIPRVGLRVLDRETDRNPVADV
ncbi:unnamed protein product, partial [Iphiclides podalirius]